jgi:hypothetical protein
MLAAIACSNVLITQIFPELPATISHGLPCRKQERRACFRTRNQSASFYSWRWRRSESRPRGAARAETAASAVNARQVAADAGP